MAFSTLQIKLLSRLTRAAASSVVMFFRRRACLRSPKDNCSMNCSPLLQVHYLRRFAFYTREKIFCLWCQVKPDRDFRKRKIYRPTRFHCFHNLIKIFSPPVGKKSEPVRQLAGFFCLQKGASQVIRSPPQTKLFRQSAFKQQEVLT